MAGEDGAFGNDGLAGGEIVDEGECAGVVAVWRVWSGSASVAGKIGNEYAEILIGELLRIEGHDFFVGGEAVEENDRADRRAGARFVNVGGHLAAADGGEDGVHFVGLAMCEVVAERAKEQARGGLQKQAAIHREAGCLSKRAEKGPSRAA
jgi:hypothetical protein